ncbi:hypothetical protein [Xylanibacter caecicola]|uniref:hypothetical protein n=1 Tax=Xylanibacter caecicola TaxID=2736294 RepID=UPI002588836B|nr:hypothetical protein [Xylanibacter caecicola]
MKKLANLKFMVMAMFVAMLSMSLTACSDDDDDDVPGVANYFIECKMNGGGLTNQELMQLESGLNSELSQITIKGATKSEAIYTFDEVILNLKRKVFVDGLPGISGTLNIAFSLKTTDGIVAKSAIIKVTKNGCE